MLRRMLTALLVAAALPGAEAQPARNSGLTLKYSINPEPVTVTVSGIVRDKNSGGPITNALIRGHIVVLKYQAPDLFEKCPYQETTTDAQGEYRLTFVTPLTSSGPHAGKDGLCVYASAPRYETQPQYARTPVTAQDCAFTNFNFQLGVGKPVRGTVVNSDGQPVSGASVRVQNSSNGDWNFFGALGRTVTGADGSFQLWLGTDTDYLATPWLCISKPGAGTLRVWDLLAKDDLGKLTLEPGGELTGRVIDAFGAPVPDCEISVRGFPFSLLHKTLTDQDGKYVLQGIPGESSQRSFMQRKNRQFDPVHAQFDIYARPNPEMSLKDAPHFAIAAKDGQTTTCPDLVANANASVSGTLLPSRTALGFGGLLVRLDDKWENMVEVEVNGQFVFPFVSPGKHTLTAYLPHNLRYDRGIGQTRIELQPGQPLQNVQIQLADLAELRVQYLDAQGNPLPGISASATWSKSGNGGWTEGTVSDTNGWTVLYLYPDNVQYLGGFDRSRKLTAESVKELNPRPGEVMESLQVVMVPTSRLAGRLLDSLGQPLIATNVMAFLSLADGTTQFKRLQTGADGRFVVGDLIPGILKLVLETGGVVFPDPLGKAIEVRPGATEDLGDVALKDGVNKAKLAKEKQARAVNEPQELTLVTQEFFEKIRTADYDRFLKPNANWQQFPIVGSYQTLKWFDNLVQWSSQTFKTNPITRVELGQVFPNPQPVNRQKDLPTVPYKLTLKDGTLLEGNLPFQYEYEAGTGRWFGVQGIDWHLRSESKK